MQNCESVTEKRLLTANEDQEMNFPKSRLALTNVQSYFQSN